MAGSWNLFVEVAGWCAALAILGAYALLSTGKLAARSATYQWMNIVGAVGFIINSGWNGAMPSAALNAVWLVIAVYALRRNRRRGRHDVTRPRDGSAAGRRRP